LSFLNNIVWSLINVFGVQILALITNTILARILYPEIFGILGMAMVFAGLVLVFQEAGLSSYIIYKDNISKKEEATSFWLNIGLSIILSILLIISSNKISLFFNQPDVKAILIYISIGLLFSSIGITSRAVLMKEKNFKILTIVDVISEIFSSILSIYFALNGHILLAISARLVIKPIIQTLLLVFLKNDFILVSPSRESVISIVPFSSRYLGSQLFVYLNNNIDYLLIGKLLGSKSLGIYTMAYQWSVLARLYISGSINKVAFPEIASAKDNLLHVRDLFLNIIRKLSFITFPICLGLIAIANEFVMLIYGDKWYDAIPVLQLLLISGAITSIGTLGGSVISGLGKPQIEMKLNLYSLIVLIIVILSFSFFGIKAIALGILLRTIIFDGIKVYIVTKLIRIKQSVYYREILPSAMTSILMLIIIYITKGILEFSNPLVSMITSIIIGIIAYILLSFWLNRSNISWYMKKLSGILNFQQLNIKQKV